MVDLSGCRVTATPKFWELVQAGSTPVIPITLKSSMASKCFCKKIQNGILDEKNIRHVLGYRQAVRHSTLTAAKGGNSERWFESNYPSLNFYIIREKHKMNNNLEKLTLENRIALLKTRSTECGNIIKKLERRIRKIEKEN